MKVLIVDDNATIRVIVKRFLEPLGLKVIEAGDGQQAILQLHEDSPDLLILDINMPQVDGLEVLEHMKRTPAISQIPVIILTADSTESLVLSLIRTGITDYIVKPFQRQLLVKKVSRILNLHYHVENGEGQGETEKENMEENKPCILVLDEDTGSLRAISGYLNGRAQLFTTASSEEAVAWAVTNRPEIVFLGLGLADDSAINVFHAMLSQEELSSTRFVAIANRSMTEEITAAKRAGFQGIVLKPFDQETLFRLIEQQSGWLVNLLR